ncbi:3604_t:CDS:10 [Ambispora leptoticha]|uniref:HECT-type E3 ubiquitin transferase n=1 Tax=Ambispora leptoticha TaxID=144679 RepID=A0A9N8V618_9GLOM|nr:3604_t:CDS:10 [Ambispora leptoticha]
MKIKKTPPKKLSVPIPPIKNIIQLLTDCQDEEIPNVVASIREWSYPRGDLFHWIGVLNRFDTILENICQKYKLKKLQSSPFTTVEQSILLAILKFSRLLLENCTNRNLYSSYEHLNDLLNTADLDVLETVLRLVLRPAQRLSNQRALRTNFSISQDRILTLAHAWGTKEYDLGMKDLAYDNVTIPEELKILTYQFYRHLTPTEAATGTSSDTKKIDTATATAASTTATTTSISNNTSTSSPKHKRKESTGGEGITVISVSNAHELGESDIDILKNVVEEYEVPEEFHFALLNRIRIATKINNSEKRKQLLIIRILAIAIMAHVIPEHVAQTKLFLYEPDIVANLAELVHPEQKNAPEKKEIQTVAFYALDGISRYRSKLGEVLNAINASANHGVLLYLLRRVIADLESENPKYPQEYLDALFALISCIISTQTGGTMVISAGIVPTLLQLLRNKKNGQEKNVTKAVVILDSLVYGFTTSFNTFCNANGVNILVDRIKDEVNFDIELANEIQGNSMEEIRASRSISSTFGTKDDEFILPYERSSLLKSMFKFVLHMMQTSGTADGLRNLIETSLPESLNKVLDHPIFGSSIYSLAIHLMATFIHNEPTSLPIMQEARLPQTFLSSISTEIPTSVDVLQQIPNAFGAICLNAQGLEMFNEANPINKFFTIFTSQEHVRSIQEGDIASQLGTSIDELMRHHPSLKPTAMNAIIDMLKRIVEIGQGDVVPINDDNSKLHYVTAAGASTSDESAVAGTSRIADVTMTDSTTETNSKPEEKKDNFLVSLIEVASKFLDGLFQNSSHCKDFLKQNGLDIIIKFYSLPTLPFDFGNTPASYALSNSMRLIADVDSKSFVKCVISALNTTLQDAKILLDSEKDAVIFDYIDLNDKNPETIEAANKTFRSLVTLYGLVGLLSDIYYTPGFSHTKSSPSVIEAFVADNEVLPALGKLHRVCVWENVILKSKVPKSWYSTPNKLRKTFSVVTESSIFGVPSLDDADKDTTPSGATDVNEPPVDQSNHKVKNTKAFKFLVSQIPSCLTPLFQGLTKMLFSRKSPEAYQKKQAFKVSDTIAEVLRDHLIWKNQATNDINKYNYLSSMLGLLSLLFLDERNQMALQTMLVVSFDRVDGNKIILDLLRKFWGEAEAIQALEDYTLNPEDGSKEKLSRIHGCLEITLNFFQFITSAKPLRDSPHTSALTSKDRDRGSADFFDPTEFLINIRSNVFPVISELWQSSYLETAPANIVKSVIQNLVQILKGDGEVNQRAEGSSTSSSNLVTNPYVFGRTLVPDEARIQQLCDMGFPRSAAETALLRSSNTEENTQETRNDTQTETTYAEQITSLDNAENEEESSSNDDQTALEQAIVMSMQGDAEDSSLNGSSVPMDMDPVSKKAEKGKGKEVSTIEQFKSLRESIKMTAAQHALDLLTKVEDIIFEVRDLFVLISKEKFESSIELVFKSIEDASIDLQFADTQRTKVLGSRLRLLALLLNEASIQTKISTMPLYILPIVLDLISHETTLSVENPLSNWLAPALLVVEAFISLADEPTTVPLDYKPEDSKDNIDDIDTSKVSVTDEQRSSLLGYTLTLIEKREFDKDVRHALLRILVRLTRRHSVAIEFVKRNGLPILFNLFKSKAHDFHRQQVFIVMILRHIVEDAQILETIMDREIKNWFSHPRPRVVDINTYLRNNSQFTLRDPQVFVQSTKNVCKLAKYDSSGRNPQITLVRPEADEDNIVNEEEMTDVIPSTSASAEKGKKSASLSNTEGSENLVYFLANELMTIREHTPKQTNQEKQATNDIISGSSSTLLDLASVSLNNNTNSNQPATITNFKPEENQEYLSRCFILQCLTELLSSYPSCKIEVVNLSRRRTSTGPNTPTKHHRPALVNYLLNDLLPYGCVTQTTDVEMRKRLGQSKWTVAFFVALCSYNNESEDKKPNPEIAQVRKFVLDCINRAFNSAILSNEPLEAKYGRLLGLAELCYELLTARNTPNNNVNKPIEDGPSSIAKLMLDKKFVDTLTSALAEVDLNYPSSKNLINALLKPFEFLTKVAIKIGRTPEPSSKDAQGQPPRRDSISSVSSLSTEEIHTEVMDTPDLYQNSVLGALEGRLNPEPEVDDSSEDDEETYEHDEYEESGSDLSDVSHEESEGSDNDEEGDDMDVEIVIPPSAQRHSEMSDDEDEDPDFEINHHGDIEVIENEEGRRHRHTRHDPFAQDDDDEISASAIRPRALFSFGNRRHRGISARRAILEVQPDSLDYLWGDTSDQGRHEFLGNEDLPGLGRSRPITTSVDDVSSHPLLINRSPALPTVSGSDQLRGRSSRNGPLGDWTQSIEELIGGGAVQLLEQLLNRGRGLGGPSTYRLELNPGSTGLVSGIEVDRMFARPLVTSQDSAVTTLSGDPVAAVQEFTPAPTSQRWYDEARIMYGTGVADKAAKLVNHILNALVPQALIEEKKRKEEEARKLREEEERRLREEEERKQVEEENRKKEEDKDEEYEEAERVRLESEFASTSASTTAEDNQATLTEQITSNIIESDVMIEDAPPIEHESAEIESMAAMEEQTSFIIEATRPVDIPSSGSAMEEETTVSSMETAENIIAVGNTTSEEVTSNLDISMGSESGVPTEETTAATSVSDVAMTTESTSATNEAAENQSETANAPPAQERTTVMVNGESVDITDTGIDPTFLEALPEDLRQEVLNEHLPRHRARPAAPAAEMDNATFFATLDPILRQQVLMEQDEMILQSLPPAIVAEAHSLRERANRRYTSVRSRTALANAAPLHAPKKPTVHRDAMKLVDTEGLATLVRLLFLPQALGKNLLHKLLLNLCENSKTRGELISMLLSILQDGSADVAAVDKSFAQMSLKNKGTPHSTIKGKGNSANILSQIAQTAGENVPNLIAQRCLEALTYIITYNEASVNYFLTEHEQIIGLKRSNSKKGKEKQSKVITSKYPVVVLLSLLDKQVFVKNTTLMDQLMHLLSFVLRPLSTMTKSESAKSPSSSSQSNNGLAEGSSTADTGNLTDTVSNDPPATEQSNTQSSNEQNIASNNSTVNESTDLPDEQNTSNNDSNNPNSNTNLNSNQNNNESANNQQGSNSNTENSNSATAGPSNPKPSQSETPTLKPPVIPDHCLRLVVNVLTAGECTSNTFKYTSNVINYLSTLSGARDVITSELVEKAQSLGNDILEDLDELAQVLEQANSGVDVQGVTLSNFSPSSSKQAKLLRVLKTIDYMYSKRQPQQPTTTSNTQVEVALAPTVDPEQADTTLPRTKADITKSGTKLTQDEEKVMNIYDSLQFTDLWKKLGRCLTTIHEKSDMIHVATVLLPLIESLMVVCKYVGMRPTTTTLTSQAGETSVTTPTTAKTNETMDELFFTFTEDHRKILNTMVRNNPSLMSGSFSLLVHNPKILEFDNKRNYFTQQLHKRPSGREHYGTLQLNVRRQYVFEDSFQYLQRRSGDEIKYGKLSVRFYEEEGVDAGGVTREWFQVLARQMFNENYALFKTSNADRLTYQPNRASFVNPEHLLFFKFVGRVIGKAIYDGRLLDAYFTRSFYKHILGKPVDYRDVEAIDLEYYNSLVWILENDISAMDDLTFSVEDNDFGATKQVELKPGGANIRVTEENKREYVKLVTEQKLTLAIKDQIANFLAGFHEIIPPHLISIFNEQELELLISGMPDIDIDDWKNNTEYQNYTSSSPQIQWFWRAVRSFDQEERAKLLQFVTGTSKVPLEGFSALQGVHGVQKFQIHKDFSSPDRLPSAHTWYVY